MKLTKQRLIEIVKEEYKSILNEKRVRLKSMDINFNRPDQAQLLGYKGRVAIDRMDAKGIMYAVKKEFSISESTGELNEKTIKTKSGLKMELTRKGSYELVRIYGRKGYVEVYGRKNIQQFVNVLKKNFRIV